jgi:hypothetical protein
MRQILFLLFFQLSLFSQGPDFIVIGVAKAGTTSLYDYLNDHPMIKMPETKEIHFFDEGYDQGIESYLKHFPKKKTLEYPLSGDVTPRYFVKKNVPKRVKNHFPDVKLILLLRNPVDRAFSHYKQHLFPKTGDSFEKHLAREFLKLSNKKNKEDLPLLQRGFYVKHLKEWLKIFPKEQILVLIAEDFYKNTQESMNMIYEFLNIASYQHKSFPISNEGVYKGIALHEKTRALLEDFYKPYNEELQSLFDEFGFNIKLTWDKK